MDRLIYKNGRKTIASKPWCFKAMCIIDDGRENNIFDMCKKIAEYSSRKAARTANTTLYRMNSRTKRLYRPQPKRNTRRRKRRLKSLFQRNLRERRKSSNTENRSRRKMYKPPLGTSETLLLSTVFLTTAYHKTVMMSTERLRSLRRRSAHGTLRRQVLRRTSRYSSRHKSLQVARSKIYFKG